MGFDPAQGGGSGSGGTGDVTGPASSTANAIPRFSGTGGKTLKNSGITIDDSNDVTVADGTDIVLGSTTGTKIGTASTEKLAFLGATPIVRQGQPGTASFSGNYVTDGATIVNNLNSIRTILINLGLIGP